MVEAKTITPRTGALKVQVEDIDKRIVSISQVVEEIQSDVQEIKALKDEVQTLKDKAAEEASTDMVVVIDRLKISEDKVEVLLRYIKMFNIFLNSSMITNAVDPSAEESLSEVLDQL
tara:strand:+ start:221 stop:571 length:351 start_codon:yes stop_codon:yes gene_type:complete